MSADPFILKGVPSSWAAAPTPLRDDDVDPPHARTVVLTSASSIKVRPVRWLWQDRVPLGSLALIGGREGIGKSTLAYTLAAQLTAGTLPGRCHGQPRAVIVAATEDSWAHTIVPRLMAAGADLERIYRVEVTTSDNLSTGLSLPMDLVALERHVRDVGAGMILLDPLMSRLAASLDAHRDAEVRRALEPLTMIADRTEASVLGLIHVNKSTTSDPLTMLMGSRAFAAVARAVLFVAADPDDVSGARVIGQPKNNLGRTDLPTLSFGIISGTVGHVDGEPITTGKLVWNADSSRSLTDVLESTAEGREGRSAAKEAGDWLLDYLILEGGSAASVDIKRDGAKAGHSQDALKRARTKVGVTVSNISRPGVPRSTVWNHSQCSPGESALITPIALIAPTDRESEQSGQSVQSAETPREASRLAPDLSAPENTWAAAGYDR